MIYSYMLKIKPCPFCNRTKIELFEDDELNIGGGKCECGFERVKPIPKVPSMHMLLDIWNGEVYVRR